MDVLSVVSLVVGVVSLLATVGFGIYQLLPQRGARGHEAYEWHDVSDGAKALSRRIRKARFVPDAVVTIPGGSLVVSMLLLTHLRREFTPVIVLPQCPDLPGHDFPACLMASAEFSELKPNGKWRYLLPGFLNGQRETRLLVVMDFSQTGGSLKTIRSELLSRGVAERNLRTAALLVDERQENAFDPDFEWRRTTATHVHMPWGNASKWERAGLDDGQ